MTPGSRLHNRYEFKHEQVFLDTQPGQIPENLPEIPAFVLPYLLLSAYPLQIPRPYALLSRDAAEPLLLLDEAAIAAATATDIPTPLPGLAERWSGGTALQQLNWFWQIAQLWSPLAAKAVVSSLLQLPLVRVDGSVLRLLTLQPDSAEAPPDLSALGSVWQPLADTAHPAIRDFLQTLCSHLQQHQFDTAETLENCLDRAIERVAASTTITYEAAVQTDQGPVRQRNEDACYPASGITQHYQVGPPTPAGRPILLIVCDGIGGHQGGDVASKLAIATVQTALEPLLHQSDWEPDAVTHAIEAAICAANDQIAQQNDQEARQARDRMGTTLVLALVLGPQLYIAHIGDSRAYRISPHSCHQITLDDDVAAREVRLGYGFYPEVVGHPGAGALVQALGMTDSETLYPSVQRFWVDEACLFLLCSDGLSDNDRVEQFWRQQLTPILLQQQSLTNGVSHLIQLANSWNGHDNVTVALLHIRPASSTALPPLSAALAAPVHTPQRAATATPGTTPATLRVKPPPTRSVVPWLFGSTLLVGLASALVALFWAGNRLEPQPPLVPTAAPLPTPLATGAYAQVRSGTSLLLYAAPRLVDPANPALSETILGRLAPGSVVQIVGQQVAADQARWLRIKVCTFNLPTDSEPGRAAAALPPGSDGWLLDTPALSPMDRTQLDGALAIEPAVCQD
jgi:serine/threonine protein phosphatase PrpC